MIILIWALVVALVRMIPGKAGTPLRWLAIAYADLFRGIPTLLVLYIVVFGFPPGRGAAVLQPEPRQPALLARRPGVHPRPTAPTSSEVYRAGIESIHWSQTAAARSLGLSHAQTLRYVVVPQAVRRIIPPLLNDFIGLQKDTALVSVVGVLDVVNRATILKGTYFNLSSITGAAVCFLIITIPLTRFTDWLVARDQRAHAGPRVSDAVPRASTDVHKRFGDNEVLRGINLDVDEHQVVCLIGPSGCGKSTLLRCINGLETIQGGEIVLDGERVSGRGVDLNALRHDVGIVFQSFNLFPHMTVLENVTLAPRKVLKLPKGYADGAGDGAAGARRARREGDRVPRPAVGRPAAARRHRAGAGHGAAAAPARRDHLCPRPRAGVGGAEHRPASWPPRA